MQLRYRLLVFFFILNFTNAFSQGIKLKIVASQYENEIVYLWIEDDYFSGSKSLLEQKVIQNGEAIFSINISSLSKIRIAIDYQYGSLFIDNNRDYELVFPIRDESINRSLAWNTQVDLVFVNLPDDDINLQISRFNRELDESLISILSVDHKLDSMVGKNEGIKVSNPKFSQKESLAKFISYQATWDSLYQTNDSPFFHDYRRFTGASIAYSLGQKRIDLYDEYLKSGSIVYNNPEFAHFFNLYYQNFLDRFDYYPMAEKKDLAFTSPDPKHSLEELLRVDSVENPKNETELILLKSLYDYYPKHIDSTILAIFEDVSMNSLYPENRLIATNYLKKLKKGKKGSAFPDFHFINTIGDTVALSDFKGQMIFLQLFASWNSSSLAELALMNELNRKYGSSIRFISLSIDKEREDFNEFLSLNKKYRWELGWIGVHPRIIELLSIYDLPLFYLISDDFSIVEWHSLWPSTGIEKVFYDRLLKEKEEKKFRFWEDQTNKSKRD